MADTIDIRRPARAYIICVTHEGGGRNNYTITVAPGMRSAQDVEAEQLAEEIAEEWVRDGEWGDDGACISVYISIQDAEDLELRYHCIDVDIEPDHDALIAAAGGDTTCKHEWSSEGEGGCDENPGVWSTGGTSMCFRAHCVHCGLIRIETTTGAQRNPGEHNTVRYTRAGTNGEDDGE